MPSFSPAIYICIISAYRQEKKLTYRDQLIMFPITSRTIRSCQTNRGGKMIYKWVILDNELLRI